ncbi:MAG: signal peptidase II [Pseudomonadota bacterium]|nr:signal peptidase II [Pseudomonadota bacterium]
MPRAAGAAWMRWLLVSAAVVVLDLATKAWVSAAFQYGESRVITPFFNLVLVHNTGAAFSFLAGAGGWQRWFFTVVTIVISVVIVVMLRRDHENRLLASSLALVLGGALGNLHDRVRFGYVVDFVQLHAGGYSFPAFNVADSAITVGVALLIWDSLRSSPRAPGQVARQEKP